MGNPVTLEELLASSLAQTDALAKLLIEKGLITREEFMRKISEERATYQKLLTLTAQSTLTVHKTGRVVRNSIENEFSLTLIAICPKKLRLLQSLATFANWGKNGPNPLCSYPITN
jgi:hypothetical protein